MERCLLVLTNSLWWKDIKFLLNGSSDACDRSLDVMSTASVSKQFTHSPESHQYVSGASSNSSNFSSLISSPQLIHPFFQSASTPLSFSSSLPPHPPSYISSPLSSLRFSFPPAPQHPCSYKDIAANPAVEMSAEN